VTVRRVAIAGFGIECNRFAPEATLADFACDTWLWGEEIVAAVRGPSPHLVGELAGAFAVLDAAGPWQAVPLGYAWAHPNGPVDHGVFASWLGRVIEMLTAAGPVDDVLLIQHGAALTTDDDDPDGLITEEVRRIVGRHVPIVVTLDLHANLTRRMLGAADVTIAYRTNPHVDMRACGEAAARSLLSLRPGQRPAQVLIRLPIVPPTVTMLTAGDGPFAAMRRAADRAIGGDILDVSVLGSFPHSDTADNGLAVLATAWSGHAAAYDAACRVAAIGWEGRAAFDPVFVTAEQAASLALRLPRRTIALADLGDNPGGGGRGTETALLEALLSAGATDAVFGLLHDPALAEAAHAVGLGGRIALGGTQPTRALSRYGATVRGLSDGRATGRRGLLAGVPIRLGPSAALDLGGTVLAVSSIRFSPNDPACFEHLDIDLSRMRTIALKSRGHFRAGFDEFVAAGDVIEVATPGLTTPLLLSLPWRNLPRPVIPLDPVSSWAPPSLDDCAV
jgi:microcystin degradation protein MlrC